MSTPGIGHNRPDEREPIAWSHELTDTVNRWLRERPVIDNEEHGGIAQELLHQLRQCEGKLEEREKAERKPHDDAVAAIRVKYRDPKTLIGICKTKMSGLLTPWLQAKERRLQEEATRRRLEAEAAAREAERNADAAMVSGSVEAQLEAERAIEAASEAADAAAKPKARAQVKGDLAPRASSLVPRWYAKVIDEDRALAHFGKHPEVREVALAKITQIASKLARETKRTDAAPPGCRFIREETAR